MKELARELNVPLLSAAQLSRAVEQRQDKRPQLSDLRESGCLTGDTLIYLPDSGCYVPIEKLVGKQDFRVTSLNPDTWKLEPATVSRAFSTGCKPVYRLTTQLGRSIRATANHKFLTLQGWKRLDELNEGERLASPHFQLTKHKDAHIVTSVGIVNSNSHDAMPRPMLVFSPALNSEREPGGEVYWDKIASIEPDGDTMVYDLTVPGNSNFVANDIIAHNSIEQDADIVMFLYRDEVYNEATEFPNQADVIVAKHRNGPTGVVSLYFDKKITRFLDATAQNIDLSRG
jgi:replicative DNA helicase